ncbi:MAG TPA: collagen-like protein, partial [Oscillospiraceae bacterium]|nr:collagen-like protein [Oscillospiraceae bacterium]
SVNINYNAGVFTITEVGNYYVTWWVSTDGAGPSTSVSFGIELNGGGAIIASSPIVSGQLNGSALLSVGAVPATVTLVNETGEPVNIGITPIQANMVIIELAA